ncbi:MAG: DNA repair protein RadC [Burkholderiales bacterium]|nr:MAG: DNA repair protein RadC [Burkholderiales bacterium]
MPPKPRHRPAPKNAVREADPVRASAPVTAALSLPDRDLLAAFLGRVAGGPSATAAADAERALAVLGGFRGLVSASQDAFCALPGMGPAGFARLHTALEIARRALAEEMRHGPALERPEHVQDYLKLWLLDRGHEVFCVLFLDGRHRLIVAEELFRGTLTQTAVYPREVVRRALQVNAAALVFVHNHPSGAAAPSAADEQLTLELRRALALVDVRVLDHCIVAGPRVYSFAAHGLI